jgi:hypothetical protein
MRSNTHARDPDPDFRAVLSAGDLEGHLRSHHRLTALAYTRLEVDAGDDLTKEIADLSGWTVNSGFIDTPDMGKRYTSKIGGRITTPDSSLTMYGDKAGVDVRTILPRGTQGYLVFMDGGDVAGQPSDVFKVEVAALGKPRSTGDTAFQLTVQFSISDFAEDVDIPA